jgi:hypothetical protein
VPLVALKVLFDPPDLPGGGRVALPFEPRAAIWGWAPAAPGANLGGIGFAAANGTAGVGWATVAGSERTNATSWTGDAPVALDESGLTLRWEAAPPQPMHVHCLAIGGADVHAVAGVVAAPTAPGRQSVDGIGFRPDLVLCAAAPDAGLLVSFGAAAAGGDQAVTAYASVDGAPPRTVGGCQRIGAAIAAPATDGSKGVSALARVASFDHSGLALDWSAVDGVRSVAYLALAGGSYEVGVDAMPRRTRVRTTWLERTAPAAVLMSSWGLAGGNDTRQIARVSLGAASSARDAGSVVWGEVGPVPASVTHTLARSSAAHVIQVADTSPTGTEPHAEATMGGLRKTGFTLEWPQHDGERPRQFVYVAFGAPVRRTLRSMLRRTRRRARRSMRALLTR